MLRDSHLLLTASAHDSISRYGSVAAALCLNCCLCLLGMMYLQKGARSVAPAFPVHASRLRIHQHGSQGAELSAIIEFAVACDFPLRSGRSLIATSTNAPIDSGIRKVYIWLVYLAIQSAYLGLTHVHYFESFRRSKNRALCEEEAKGRPTIVHGIHAQRAMSRRASVPVPALKLQ